MNYTEIESLRKQYPLIKYYSQHKNEVADSPPYPNRGVSIATWHEKGTIQPLAGMPLAHGLDKLDVNIYGEWQEGKHDEIFNYDRQAHELKEAILFNDEERLFIPPYKGKCRVDSDIGYFHIAQNPDHERNTPNIEFKAHQSAIWHLDRELIESEMYRLGQIIGFDIRKYSIQRCDYCSDWWLSNRPGYYWLKQHAVGLPTLHPFGDPLETGTYYIGKAKTRENSVPCQAKMYDKKQQMKDMLEQGKKDLTWLEDFWKDHPKDCGHIWRLEFQLNREGIKNFEIKNIDDVYEKAAEIWAYNTKSWFSVRENDNKRQNRRTVHPWWQEVQSCYGIAKPAKRKKRVTQGMANESFYLERMLPKVLDYLAASGEGLRECGIEWKTIEFKLEDMCVNKFKKSMQTCIQERCKNLDLKYEKLLERRKKQAEKEKREIQQRIEDSKNPEKIAEQWEDSQDFIPF
jgi:hypothetical protein